MKNYNTFTYSIDWIEGFMDKIKEFTKEHVEENSTQENGLFYDFLHSKEPYQSIFKNNPWMMPPDLKRPLEWGGGQYWDTTVARKHEYWKEFNLPKPSKDINKYNWQKKHEENLTGTPKAYKPEGSLFSDSKKNMKKYETWNS